MRRLLFAFVAATLVAAPASAVTFAIPGAAHAPGAHDTEWVSDVWLFDSNTTDAEVTYFVQTTGMDSCPPSAGNPISVHVPARATVRVADPLGAAGVAQGWIEVLAPRGVLVRAETRNQVTGGSYGQRIPVLTSADFAPAGRRVVLAGGSRSDLFRTNLVILTEGASCGEVPTATLTLLDPLGAPLAVSSLPLTENGQTFVYDAFAKLGAESCELCRIDVEADVPTYPFLSVVDNRTGDPTLITPSF